MEAEFLIRGGRAKTQGKKGEKRKELGGVTPSRDTRFRQGDLQNDDIMSISPSSTTGRSGDELGGIGSRVLL